MVQFLFGKHFRKTQCEVLSQLFESSLCHYNTCVLFQCVAAKKYVESVVMKEEKLKTQIVIYLLSFALHLISVVFVRIMQSSQEGHIKHHVCVSYFLEYRKT